MSTTIGDLLDTIVAQAHTSSSSDRAAALAHLGRMLASVRVDGLTTNVDSSREQHVTALAAACWAQRTSGSLQAGRLSELAAAATDAAATLRSSLTCRSRWALALAYADTVRTLAAVDQFNPPTKPIEYESLRLVHVAAQHVARDGALDPPTARDSIVLDHPIPGPARPDTVWAEDVLDAMASLLHETRGDAEPLTIIQTLAVTLAAERLAGLAAELAEPIPAMQSQAAAAAWRTIRIELRPFTDGTRRPQDYMPPVAEAAARLHTSASIPFHSAGLPARQRWDIAIAAQHLPALADNLARTVTHWTQNRTLLANARNLPPREERTDSHLFRYRHAGIVRLGDLIRGDSTDLSGVHAAVRDARTLAVALAADVSQVTDHRKTRTPESRLANAHRAEVSTPRGTAALEAARHEAYRRMRPVDANPHQVRR